MIEYKNITIDEASSLNDWTPFGWRVTASSVVGTKKCIQLARDTDMQNYQRLAELERQYTIKKREAVASAREIVTINEKFSKTKMLILIIVGLFLLFAFSGSYEAGTFFSLIGTGLLIGGLAILVCRLVKGSKPQSDYKQAVTQCTDCLIEAESIAS